AARTRGPFRPLSLYATSAPGSVGISKLAQSSMNARCATPASASLIIRSRTSRWRMPPETAAPVRIRLWTRSRRRSPDQHQQLANRLSKLSEDLADALDELRVLRVVTFMRGIYRARIRQLQRVSRCERVFFLFDDLPKVDGWGYLREQLCEVSENGADFLPLLEPTPPGRRLLGDSRELEEHSPVGRAYGTGPCDHVQEGCDGGSDEDRLLRSEGPCGRIVDGDRRDDDGRGVANCR